LDTLESLVGKKALIFCSAGGHLKEALLIYRQLRLSTDSIFFTHENDQSKSLLSNNHYYFVVNAGTRDVLNTFNASRQILSNAQKIDFDIVVSTGAAIALSALPLSLFRRKGFYFFESLTRIKSPSLTGRILEWFPFVRKFSSNFGQSRKCWNSHKSILEEFHPQAKWDEKKESMKLFITLGTHSQYRFDRLIELVLSVLKPGDLVTWQLGTTTGHELPGTVHKQLTSEEFTRIATDADVVITHCGIGTVITLLELGISPIAIPRNPNFLEHIDEHQIEAFGLFKNDLNLIRNSIDSLSRKDLEIASRYRNFS